MRHWFTILLITSVLLIARDTTANRALPDYRYFRALTIDLLGRPPTRDEISSLEQPGFSFEVWLDSHLTGAAYAERLRRVYMDLIRLELPETSKFEPLAVRIRHVEIHGPHGPLDIYFRNGQRRLRPELDGQICFTEGELGLTIPLDGAASGAGRTLSQALLDERTVEIKPWWLYADYRAKNPTDHVNPDWSQRHPGYELYLPLFVDANKSPTTSIRVCKEEAQVATTGRIVMTGRVAKKGMPLPPGRSTQPPSDSLYAQGHAGQSISCVSNVGWQSSIECGCGVGLERCLPSGPNGFVTPMEMPLGIDAPFVTVPRPASMWFERWLSEEATHFMDRIFIEDRDVRELLTSRATTINGPLAQFYRFLSGGTLPQQGADLGYVEPEPLFDPATIPSALVPQDVASWTTIPDRGSHASGVLTMPIFLVKYGTRRARAHILYTAFLCKDFVADTVKLAPSKEPDLMKRPGCSTCHHQLEPMAAFFARVQESDWTYLPAKQFPISLDRCVTHSSSKTPYYCSPFYDPAFTTTSQTSLRGSYASPAHAEAGPAGLAAEITAAPEFASCVVRNVAQSLLGRQLTPDDDGWKARLAKDFVDGGYRMRSLIRAIMISSSYRDSNDHVPEGR